MAGGGVGEAMLIGAAVGATAGGAGAAIQGGDPLKGALLGAAMGGVGGGLGGAFTGAAAAPATGVGSSAAASSFGSGLSAAGTGAAGGAGTGAAFGSGLSAGTGALPTTFMPLGTGLSSTLPAASSGIAGGGGGISALGTGAASLPGNFTGMAPALSNTQLATIGGTSLLGGLMQNKPYTAPEDDYVSSFDPSKFQRSEPTYAPASVYVPQYRDYTTAAEGGIVQLANGGPVERMSMMNTAMNPQGGLYPQGMIDKTQYATPIQRPVSSEMISEVPAYERSNPMLMAEGGIASMLEAAKAQGLSPEAYQQIYGRGNAIMQVDKALKEGKPMTPGMASGGISSLGGYSDGGRMLKGPGDGMSDSIPGVIGGRQPARLADGEFVVPADVVSHLGNGSTDAGAKQLYAMMDKVRKARTGKKKQAPAVKANRYMPA
jgi:hypothetical protein